MKLCVWSCLCFVVMLSRPGAAEEGFIWILADLHYDPTYLTTQESCNVEISTDHLGTLGDVECDAPWSLIESAVAAMQDINETPDMLFWIGDSSHHPKSHDSLTEAGVAEAVQNCTNLLKQHFHDTEIYPVMGNHDYYPTSDMPGNSSAIYEQTAQLWADWLREEQAKETFKHASYYSQLSDTTPNLRVVAINTNLYLKYNDVIDDSSPDPGGQFEWLTTTLNSARENGEKVQLISHVPTGTLETDAGVRWISEGFNTKLNAIYRQYGDVIVGIHAGHEHMDGFRLINNEQGDAVAVILVAPSVTPWRARVTPTIIKQARNPALRSIKYDRTTLGLLDISQYYVNLTQANIEGNAQWELEYSFTKSYGVDDVTPESIQELLSELQSPNTQAKFNIYYDHVTVKIHHPESVPEVCDCVCKRGHLCSIEHVDFASYDQCMENYKCDHGTDTSCSCAITSNTVMIVAMCWLLMMLRK